VNGPAAGGMIAALRAHLADRPFLRNVSIMLGGSAAGQLVSLLSSPVLTRLYTPRQFGILSVYSALLSILVVMGSLRYELTIPMARSEKDALNLTALCVCVLLATTVAIAGGSFALPEHAIDILWPTPVSGDSLAWYRGLFAVGFLCLGGYYIALYVATRDHAFDAIAQTRLYQGIVGPASQIGFALLGWGAPGLLAGSILGQSAGTLGLFKRVLRSRGTLLRHVSWRRMAALATRYRRFPLIASWAALIDAAGGSQLLYLAVSTTYSARIAGFIFLAERVVARPLSIVGTSVLQVYMAEASRTASTDPARLKSRFRQVVSRQFALALAWILVSNLAAAVLFARLFGANWSDAVVYLQAMSLGYLSQAIVLPVFHTLQILEKQALAAGWQIARLVLVAATFFAAWAFKLEAPVAILGYSVAQAICCGALLVLMTKSIDKLQEAQA
jgi:O-antigen/teichoic acid export membrane protein